MASIGAGLVAHRMKIARMLWSANISAEYSHLDNPKFKKQLDYCLEEYIPYCVVFGEDELQNGTVKVKNMVEHKEEVVALNSLVDYLLNIGCVSVTNNSNDAKLVEQMRNVDLRDT